VETCADGGREGKRGGGGHAAGASESDRRVGDDGREDRAGHEDEEIMLH
jgi:hypothetical protein